MMTFVKKHKVFIFIILIVLICTCYFVNLRYGQAMYFTASATKLYTGDLSELYREDLSIKERIKLSKSYVTSVNNITIKKLVVTYEVDGKQMLITVKNWLSKYGSSIEIKDLISDEIWRVYQ